jgi:argininosuccinate lyase
MGQARRGGGRRPPAVAPGGGDQAEGSVAGFHAGRLGAGGGEAARAFTASIAFDRRLYRQDIAGSRAHARMLGHAALLQPQEVEAILAGLDEIERECDEGVFPYRREFEDIHLNVERRLVELIGPVGGKLHTGRSRNDQVALDMHLFVKEACAEVARAARELQVALVGQAEQAGAAPMPGYTHLQHAQPVLFAHHLLAYFFMLQRDRQRLADAARRADVSPLGAAALAGSPYPIDPDRVAADLGLGGVYANSMDAVADRDFVLETLAALAILMVHTSRLAEELVLWSSREFGFVEPADAYATGSSIMPQKKNPDVAELARGKTGRVFGDLVGLLATMKGLPLAYHSDMQEDKEALFDALDTALAVLMALAGMVATMRPNPERMAAGLKNDLSGVTDIADALARKGVPFREAHGVVGRLVRLCLETNRQPEDVSAAELAALHPLLDAAAVACGTAEAAIAARRAPGGTAPERVAEQLALARRLLAADERVVSSVRRG